VSLKKFKHIFIFVLLTGAIASAQLVPGPSNPKPPGGPPSDPSDPRPAPYPDPTPDPTPWPSPSPYPDPTPWPSPSPYPDPTPDPTPWPSPSPYPDPTPDPTPWPSPSPWPDPTPDPTPWPSPSPWPDPTPDPTPWPSPSPWPDPTPAPYPQPVPVPTPTPTPPPSTHVRTIIVNNVMQDVQIDVVASFKLNKPEFQGLLVERIEGDFQLYDSNRNNLVLTLDRKKVAEVRLSGNKFALVANKPLRIGQFKKLLLDLDGKIYLKEFRIYMR
jgi:hypothetical protein